MKLGTREIEEAVEHLLEMKAKVDTSRIAEPTFLMILTSSEFAYRRDDGVLIVLIGCLKD